MTAPRADDREAGIAAHPEPTTDAGRQMLDSIGYFGGWRVRRDARLLIVRIEQEAAHKVRDAIPAEPRCSCAMTCEGDHYPGCAAIPAEPLDAIDSERLAVAWVTGLYPEGDHNEKCLRGDETGGCPVGMEIVEWAETVAAKYRPLPDAILPGEPEGEGAS